MPTATKPRTSNRSEVHRDLHLVSPVLRGPDVHALQVQANALHAHYNFDWRRCFVDNEYGRRTKREVKDAAWLIGLNGERLEAIESGRITQTVQHLIRNPEDRSKEDREREAARRDEREARRKKHQGMRAAVDWMLAQVGTNEQPPESNHGPFPIDACQEFFGLSGVPWCGCCAGYAIKKIGGIDSGCWFPFAGSIRQDAIAGRNLLNDINPNHADVGCIATFFSGGDDHVALVRGPFRNGMIPTVEGNTSSLKQDSDGGIIEIKERSLAEVSCVALVAG